MKYSPFLVEPIETVLEKIRTPGEWAGDVEMRGFAEAMQTKVKLYRDGKIHQEFAPMSGKSERELEIAFINDNHFDLLLENQIPVDMQCMQIDEPVEKHDEGKDQIADMPDAEEIREALIQTEEVIEKMEPDNLEQTQI